MNKTQALIQQVLFSTQDSQGREVTSSVTRAIQIARTLEEHKLLAKATPEEILANLKKAVDEHDPHRGFMQWYADERSIDCDADEFWKVIRKVLEEALS